MPAIVTHFSFIDLICDKLEKNNIKINKETAFMGSIFPDVFFISNPDHSNFIHASNVESFFDKALKSQNEFDENYFSFLVGVLSHFYLDYNVHPFVFYKTGNYVIGNKDTKKYRGMHMRYEVQLDSYFSKKHFNKKLRKMKIHKYFSKLDENIIEQFNKHMEFHVGAQVNMKKTYTRFRRFYKYFAKDRFGFKKLIYKFLGIFIRNTKHKLSEISLFMNKIPDLNSDNKTWYHPCTNEKQNQSFDDMFNKAFDEMYDKAVEINNYFKNNEKEVKFLDINYDTGLNASKRYVFKYFEY